MSDGLLEEARAHGAPVIHGEEVAFVWEGKDPPQLIGDFNDWNWDSPLSLHKAGRQVWSASLNLPQDAYIEYAFIRNNERLIDPFNPRRSSNGLGKINQYFYMPEANSTPLLIPQGGPVGTVTRHVVATDGLAVGKTRLVYLYQPPVRQPSPLLVVLDGREYLRRVHLNVIVDNLIAQKRIQPLALAFVFNNGTSRIPEYTCSEATLGFLSEKVLPQARQHLKLVDTQHEEGAYGILGASLGGLMALFTGLRLVQFGKVLCQSGSFNFWDFDSVIYHLVRCGELRPVQIWMEVGHYEDLLESNRFMSSELLERGYRVTYRENNTGHNYPAWRDAIWRGLETCFGK